MQNRAWAQLVLKAVDETTRTIRGIATSPSTDREGDVLEPQGAEFALPIPLLSQHNQRLPIGQVTEARVTNKQIEIAATLPVGKGLAYVDEAWTQIITGLVRGLSVGFLPQSWEPVRDQAGKTTGGIRFTRWQWFELSAVTIPANADASIATIKRFDPWGAWAHGPGQDPGTGDGRAESARAFDNVRRRAAAALVQSRRAMR
jgi:HK97 family phage prohead protease